MWSSAKKTEVELFSFRRALREDEERVRVIGFRHLRDSANVVELLAWVAFSTSYTHPAQATSNPSVRDLCYSTVPHPDSFSRSTTIHTLYLLSRMMIQISS